MYKYSQVAGADKVIQEHLVQIIDAATTHKDWNEENTSMYLFGAYGKGEGGFINGNPVNDYDILLIGGTVSIKDAIESVDLPIKAEVWHLPKGSDLQKTQQLYEIIYGSKFMAGKMIDWFDMEPYDIPYADAINSLNRRVLSMLVGKYEMMQDDPDYYKVVTQITKMILAIGDAILIKRGQFNPSYRSRALLLNQDSIRDLYHFAVEYKLFGTPKLNPDEIWGLWNEVKKLFREYIIANQIHTDYGEMLINFDERIEKDTFKGLLEALGCGDWL